MESIQTSLFSRPPLRLPRVEVPDVTPPARPQAVVKASIESMRPKQISCNCKKSQCIKLYCECFRNESFCKNCNCECCLNKTDNQTRSNVIDIIKRKDPDAFEPKYKPNKARIGLMALEGKPVAELLIDVSRGCNCKHSNCRKKYCECYQYGLECSSKCKCVGCQNGNYMKKNPKGVGGEEFNNVSEAEKAAMREKLLEKLGMIKRVKFSKQVVG